jgi:magnesium-transporting ATPase (P-type)
VSLELLTLTLKANFQNTYLGGILILVAFINASIDFYQIQKSEAILASFLAMIPPACRVVRDGTIATIAAADLVKGDLVLLVRISTVSRKSNSDASKIAKRRQNSSRFGAIFGD